MTVSIHDLMWLYLFAINGIAFVTMGMDKRKARKGKWRVPERVLFTQAALGGSIGALAGMCRQSLSCRQELFLLCFLGT